MHNAHSLIVEVVTLPILTQQWMMHMVVMKLTKKPVTIITWVEEECSKGLDLLVTSLCRSIWSHLCLFKQLICNTNTELNGLCVTVYFYMHCDSYSP